VLAAGGSAVAATPPGHGPAKGTLSAVEYSELTHAQAGFAKVLKSKNGTFNELVAACRKAGVADSLLKTQRQSCLDVITTLEAFEKLEVAAPRCAKLSAPPTTTTGTTTTPTTTTGTVTETTTTVTTTTVTTPTATTTTGTTPSAAEETAVLQVVCLNPEYQGLSRAAKTLYPADVAERKQAVRRGFKGLCLATLVDTPKQLRAEENFSFTTTHLAADVAALAKAGAQAPTTNITAIQVQDDAASFAEATKTFLSENGPDKLSVCPHLSGKK
jgi:hypothetical protein